MILPVEMFIIEEETAAPEFIEEINEIIPTMQEEVVEEKPNAIEEAPTPDPIVEEVIPDPVLPESQEIIQEISEPKIIEEAEEILTDENNMFIRKDTTIDDIYNWTIDIEKKKTSVDMKKFDSDKIIKKWTKLLK